jgi:hypothetical protein
MSAGLADNALDGSPLNLIEGLRVLLETPQAPDSWLQGEAVFNADIEVQELELGDAPGLLLDVLKDTDA